MDKVQLVVAILVCLNIVLSAVGQILSTLGKKEIPVLSQAAMILQKIIDVIQGNVKH